METKITDHINCWKKIPKLKSENSANSLQNFKSSKIKLTTSNTFNHNKKLLKALKVKRNLKTRRFI